MDKFKRTMIASALNGAVGSIMALIGAGMSIIAFFPWNIGLFLRGLTFIALGLGYRYLAIEKIVDLKLSIIHKHLAPEKQGKLNRFDVISILFTWLGNLMFYAGLILLGLEAFNYLSSDYLDISIGLEAMGLTAISVSALYRMNNKFDSIYEGICDMDKDLKGVAEGLQEINKKIRKNNRRVSEQKE